MPVVELQPPAREAAVAFAELVAADSAFAPLLLPLDSRAWLVSERAVDAGSIGTDFRHGGLARLGTNEAVVPLARALADWLGQRAPRRFIAQNLLARPEDLYQRQHPQRRCAGNHVFFVARQAGEHEEAIRRASGAWQFVAVELDPRGLQAIVVAAFDGEAFAVIEPPAPLPPPTVVDPEWAA